jgi:hypothetical protein
MSQLTRYGRFTGNLPKAIGTVFYVAPAADYTVNGRSCAASDIYPGTDPAMALRTIARAMLLCTANQGDTIVLLPGAHSISASVAASVAGVTIIGMNSGVVNIRSPRVSITITATDQIINVTAADIEIRGIKFIPITAAAAIDISSAGHRLNVAECFFDLETPAASTSTLGIDALGAAQHMLVERCHFISDGAQGAAIDLTATLDAVVQGCTFALSSGGTWAAAITSGAGVDRAVVRDCAFYTYATSTMTAGIDGTGATVASGVSVIRCIFSDLVTVAVDNFDAGEAELAECYQSGVGATDGGVLITAIT